MIYYSYMTLPQTYIFFGRSGSGKGTQAVLLKEYIESQGRKVLYIETGEELRSFSDSDNYTAKRTKETIEGGDFMPVFMPIWIWTNKFVKEYDGTQDLILDGVARRKGEASALDSALKFYECKNINIINVVISRDEAFKRLRLRSRNDDSDAGIWKRLDWYERDVPDVLNYFKEIDGYIYHEIDGERSIEDIHEDIKKMVCS